MNQVSADMIMVAIVHVRLSLTWHTPQSREKQVLFPGD